MGREIDSPPGTVLGESQRGASGHRLPPWQRATGSVRARDFRGPVPPQLAAHSIAHDQRNRDVWSTQLASTRKAQILWTIDNSRWKQALYSSLR